MNPKFLLGAASVLVKSRKAQLLFVGLQFGYVLYKIMTKGEKKKTVKNAKTYKRLQQA